MRNSTLMGFMALVMAAMNCLVDASDIDWQTTFILFCTAFIGKTIEDLKGRD